MRATRIRMWLSSRVRNAHVMRWQTISWQAWRSAPCRSGLGDRELVRQHGWVKARGELERLLSVCPDELRDIDLERRLLTVHRGRQGTTKNGKLRTCQSWTACCRCCASSRRIDDRVSRPQGPGPHANARPVRVQGGSQASQLGRDALVARPAAHAPRGGD